MTAIAGHKQQGVKACKAFNVDFIYIQLNLLTVIDYKKLCGPNCPPCWCQIKVESKKDFSSLRWAEQ